MCAGAVLLFPQSGFKKILGYIIGLAVLISIIGAVGNIKVSFNTPAVILDTENKVNGMTDSQAAYTVKEFLNANGIKSKKVLCYTDIAGEDNISIIKARIFTDEPENKVTEILSLLDIKEVEVINE